MHITIVYQYFGTHEGSWSTRVYDFAQSWIAQGNSITVITSPYYKSDIKTKGLYKRQEIDGIDVRILNFPDSNKHSFLRRVISAITFAVCSSLIAVFQKADIVIASSGPITVGSTILLSKIFRPRVKRVFEVRDLWPEGARQMKLINEFQAQIGKYFEQLIYKNSDLIVACSPGMKDYIRTIRGIGKIITIPNIAQDEKIASSLKTDYSYPDWADSSKILLYAGSIGKMDAVEEVVYAFISAAELSKNIHLVIIGDGELLNELKECAKRSIRTSQIHFYGLLPKEEVYQWYVKAYFSLVVFKPHPVLATSSPNKFFDSIALGVPVINNTQGWIKELLESSNSGITYSNVSELMAIIEAIDKEEIKSKEFNMRDLKSEFEHNRIATKYLEKMKSLK